MYSEYAERFWNKVDRKSSRDCWEWKGAKNTQGYGIFRINGKAINASRAAYMIARQTDPGPLIIRHTCDHPPCCNPEHLIPGTIQDNRNDAVTRNRQAKGTKFPAAKLSENDVRLIRSIHIKGSHTHGARPLGRKFGVSDVVIRGIISGKGWKHVK